jgi:hypothetical protein
VSVALWHNKGDAANWLLSSQEMRNRRTDSVRLQEGEDVCLPLLLMTKLLQLLQPE